MISAAVLTSPSFEVAHKTATIVWLSGITLSSIILQNFIKASSAYLAQDESAKMIAL